MWGPLHDQIPHMILAVHYQVLATGDAAWLEVRIPNITTLVSNAHTYMYTYAYSYAHAHF